MAEDAVGLPRDAVMMGSIAVAAGVAIAMGVRYQRMAHLDDTIRKVREARDVRLAADTKALEAAEKRLHDAGTYPSDKDVLASSAVDLGAKVASREISAVALVAFFARRCLSFRGQLNAFTETRFREALAEAEALDAHLDAGGESPG